MNAENMFRDTNMWTQAGDGEKYHAQTMRSNYETFKAPAIDPPTPPASLTARSVRFYIVNKAVKTEKKKQQTPHTHTHT